MHQGKYTKDVLKKFDMGEAKPLSTPMSTLDEDKEGEAVDPEGILKHDQILAVTDGDETGHSVHGLFVRALLVLATHVSSSSRQADLQVSLFHT
jgi:hypothetical protein